MQLNRSKLFRMVCLALLPACLAFQRPCGGAETTSPPRFSARTDGGRMRERAMDIEAEIAGAKQLFLVVSGALWGWANWAEPRLVGPSGELRLTELPWKFASAGYGEPRVDANVRGDPLRINGAPVAYGIGVHDPSLIIYDLPPGYTHFRARGGLDDAGAGPVTFMVYADNPFFDPANPALWQRDCRREAAEDPPAFVEIVGGDRLPGRVIAAGIANDAATTGAVPSLIVAPSVPVNAPDNSQRESIRVTTRFVQRIVWEPPSEPAAVCEPGWARLRNGTRLRIRSARFDGDLVKLLCPDGLREATLADMAEVHLPSRDPWDGYCEEVAVLSPDMTSLLVRLETDRGAIVTSSQTRLRYLPPLHHDADAMLWHIGIQPAWSPDVLWLNENTLVARCEFPPHRVPLSCRFAAQVAAVDGLLEECWRPQTDHNVRGFSLASGGRRFSWGYGVHARCRLSFPISPLAEAFRTEVGLDHLAGDGGCARIRVLVMEEEQRQIWESPLLIGSARVHDSGRLPIPLATNKPRHLVLEADDAHANRPAATDPFAIRDVVNWLNPTFELREDELRIAAAQRLERWIPDWQGWQMSVDGGPPPRLVNRWEASPIDSPGFRSAVSTGDRPLTLTRRIESDGRSRILRLVATRPAGEHVGSAELEVLVDGRSRHRGAVPLRPDASGDPVEVVIPLSADGADHSTIQIIQRPGDASALVEWHVLEIADAEVIGEGAARSHSS